MGAALQSPLVGEHLRWAQNKLGSPLEDERMANEIQGLSRKLLRPMSDVKVDTVLGGQAGTGGSQQLPAVALLLLFCAQFLQCLCSPN